MKISYNWLKWYVPEVPEAKKLADILTYHLAEVETVEELKDGDFVLDIKILPNRAHDLLSHMGIGKEVASLLNIKYNDPTEKYKLPESKPGNLKIEVESDKCRRYMGRIIRNVKVGPSPEWVVKHLESVGQRSINNMVDAANLVMFNCGQPTHVFDLNKVKEKIVVRQAKEGESVLTLDNKVCKLGGSNTMIADSMGVIGIAGVKGGKSTEVDSNTTDIILEVANFDPTSVRKTAAGLNIFTDAKKRFENDLSPELAPYAMRELSSLILEMCPEASFEDIVDIYPNPQKENKLKFSLSRISNILGVDVSPAEVKDIFARYNIAYTENGDMFEITSPAMRLDLNIEEDMAEEIGRILGYDRVKGRTPNINFQPKKNDTYSKILWARHKLLSDGYSEVMTYSFNNKGAVEVLASASDKKFLRAGLELGILESLRLNFFNIELLGLNEIKIFEIGKVFPITGEKNQLCLGFTTKKKGSLNKLEKELSEKMSKTLEEVLNLKVVWPVDNKLSGQIYSYEKPIGVVLTNTAHTVQNDIYPDVSIKTEATWPFCLALIDFEFIKISNPDFDASNNLSVNKFKNWSLYPFIARDVAVWVPEGTKSDEVLNIIKGELSQNVVRGPELFDEFKKDGKISYAFRMVFQSFERTLTDEEVNSTMANITNKIKANPDWQVR